MQVSNSQSNISITGSFEFGIALVKCEIPRGLYFSLILAIWVCTASKGWSFSAVLVINRVLILAIFGLKLGMVLAL